MCSSQLVAVDLYDVIEFLARLHGLLGRDCRLEPRIVVVIPVVLLEVILVALE